MSHYDYYNDKDSEEDSDESRVDSEYEHEFYGDEYYSDSNGYEGPKEGYGEINESEPDYDEEDEATDFKRNLTKILATAFDKESKGCFAGSGSLSNAPNPGIDVDGVGLIGSPLSKLDAEKIMAHSQQAPFGKKDQTIVDLSVRRTWQIDASKVTLQNPRWKTYIETQVIPRVAEKLGLDEDVIEARLYKLLLYGEGGHFEAHQDTEKEPGMFGTLIIVLPSPYSGGSVTASHGSHEVIFDTAADSAFGTSFTCIYTDVFHKVHPVTSGYRFVLSYNLIFKARDLPKPTAPEADSPMVELRELFKQWPEDIKAGKVRPRFMAHMLEHYYSRVGLDFDAIKGEDRIKVNFLKDIAKELGYTIYISQIDIIIKGRNTMDRETGNPIYDTAMDEEADREYELQEGVDPDGKTLDFSDMHIDKYDATPPLYVGKWKADLKEHDDYTGNEGADVTHYYYRTILFMWPKSEDFLMKLRAVGVKSAVTKLRKKIASIKKNGPQGVNNAEDSEMLRAIADAISTSYFDPSKYGNDSTRACIDALAAAALALKDSKMFSNLVQAWSAHYINVSNWIAGIKAISFAVIKEHLETMLVNRRDDWNHEYRRPIWACKFAHELLIAFPEDQNLRQWAEQLLSAHIKQIDYMDDSTVDFLIKHIHRVGFANCHETIVSVFHTTEGKRQGSYYLRESEDGSTLKIIVKIYKNIIEDEAASKWCSDKFAELLQSLSSYHYSEIIKQIVEFLRLIIDHQPYVSIVLSRLQNTSYSEQSLKSFIHPLAIALKDTLEGKSLTFKIPPFNAFALHFITLGNSVFSKPSTETGYYYGEKRLTPETFSQAFGNTETINELLNPAAPTTRIASGAKKGATKKRNIHGTGDQSVTMDPAEKKSRV